jgi:hypothetical protein
MGSILGGGGGGGSGGGGLFGNGGSILDPLGIFKQTGGSILDPLNLLGQLKGQHPGQGQPGQQPMTPAGVQYAQQQQSPVAPGYNVSSPMGPTGFGTGSGSGKPPGQ